MISITRRFKFEAAHHLPSYQGKCRNVHGHSYDLDITIGGSLIPNGPSGGMVMDFKDLSNLVEDGVLARLDHTDLNLMIFNPTAEILAQLIFDEIVDALKDLPEDMASPDIHLISVKVWENPGIAFAECSAG